MAQKPSLPKGTRDFSPVDVAKRNYIFQIIKTEFEKFGFQPIETPSFENSDTLMGKYGEEGDRLIFKILNSGDFLGKADKEALDTKNSLKVTPSISEKALRYDLTVPFARYVVQHQNEIDFPFKRYQIQPVWRADRPQKGRFREFYQCDADVVGSKSLWQEIEFIQLYDSVFSKLKIEGTTIKINNRKILSGLVEVLGEENKLLEFTIALDKLDKIGEEGVMQEMKEKNISATALENLKPILRVTGSFKDKIETLKEVLCNSEIGKKGIEELEFIEKAVSHLSLKTASLELDVTLARGLNYYTGAILEVAAPNSVKMGSIGGGGRYDDLTGIFGLKDISGVGISFGLDRIYLVLEELDLFPTAIDTSSQVLFLNFGDSEALYAYQAITKLREKDISAELYPDNSKVKKQLNYANKRGIPFVIITGEKEMGEGKYRLKNMENGEERILSLTEIYTYLKN